MSHQRVNALVIGYGSIGERHTHILKALGHQVSVVSGRDIDHDLTYKSIPENLQTFDYVVIASETWKHALDLQECVIKGFKSICLCEKPLYDELPDQLASFPFQIFLGYNLRFHPIIQRLKKLLKTEKVLTAHMYVGQNLKLWRRGRDINDSYSGEKRRGGGVLRDLSHELDLLLFLFGPSKNLKAIGGRISTLTKDSDDVFTIVASHTDCPVVSLQMNYLDHIGQRTIIVNTERQTFVVDLVKQTLSGNNIDETFLVERNESYINMHKSILKSNQTCAATYDQGLEVMKMIQMAEHSAYA